MSQKRLYFENIRFMFRPLTFRWRTVSVVEDGTFLQARDSRVMSLSGAREGAVSTSSRAQVRVNETRLFAVDAMRACVQAYNRR